MTTALNWKFTDVIIKSLSQNQLGFFCVDSSAAHIETHLEKTEQLVLAACFIGPEI